MILIKKACPGEVRGRNPEGVFFSDPWLRGTGKRVESRIKARNRDWKPLPQAVSSPGSRLKGYKMLIPVTLYFNRRKISGSLPADWQQTICN